MSAVRQLVDELRRSGVTVHEWPGWDGRGNEGVAHIAPCGAVIHHTASNYGSAYPGLVASTRADLKGGMLANFAGNEDGSLTVLGTGLAWHAGPGVGPSLGRALGGIPNIRNLMNRLTVGLEIVYPGDSPMRPAQYRTACIFARTVADLFAGGDIECVRAHAETNGSAPGGSGKWDPGYAPGRTIDMAAFRRDASTVSLEDDMTPHEANLLQAAHDNAAEARRMTGVLAAQLAEILALVKNVGVVSSVTAGQLATEVADRLTVVPKAD